MLLKRTLLGIGLTAYATSTVVTALSSTTSDTTALPTETAGIEESCTTLFKECSVRKGENKDCSSQLVDCKHHGSVVRTCFDAAQDDADKVICLVTGQKLGFSQRPDVCVDQIEACVTFSHAFANSSREVDLFHRTCSVQLAMCRRCEINKVDCHERAGQDQSLQKACNDQFQACFDSLMDASPNQIFAAGPPVLDRQHTQLEKREMDLPHTLGDIPAFPPPDTPQTLHNVRAYENSRKVDDCLNKCKQHQSFCATGSQAAVCKTKFNKCNVACIPPREWPPREIDIERETMAVRDETSIVNAGAGDSENIPGTMSLLNYHLAGLSNRDLIDNCHSMCRSRADGCTDKHTADECDLRQKTCYKACTAPPATNDDPELHSLRLDTRSVQDSDPANWDCSDCSFDCGNAYEECKNNPYLWMTGQCELMFFECKECANYEIEFVEDPGEFNQHFPDIADVQQCYRAAVNPSTLFNATVAAAAPGSGYNITGSFGYSCEQANHTCNQRMERYNLRRANYTEKEQVAFCGGQYHACQQCRDQERICRTIRTDRWGMVPGPSYCASLVSGCFINAMTMDGALDKYEEHPYLDDDSSSEEEVNAQNVYTVTVKESHSDDQSVYNNLQPRSTTSFRGT